MKKLILLIILLPAASCASKAAYNADNIYSAPNTALCEMWATSQQIAFIDDEIKKRKIDCGPILQYQAQRKAAVIQAWGIANRPPQSY